MIRYPIFINRSYSILNIAKKMSLFCLLVICLLMAQQSEAQDITSKLTQNKWALTSYIQVEGMKFDTLFTALDCESEYIQFNKDASFKDTNLKKLLKFEVSETDSVITFKKQSGITHKKSRISLLTEDKLTLVDVNSGKGLFYIETYTRCTGSNTTNAKDSRDLVEIGKQTSVLVGLQQWETSTFEVGVSWLKKDWRKNAIYKHMSLQINPADDILGFSTSLTAQNIFLYGAGASVYTDFDDVQIGLQPIIGITGKAFGGFGENIQLQYSYIFPFLGNTIDVIKPHSLTLRINFPIKKSTQQVRRIKSNP